MKILGICGSPRKGNTEQMLEWVLESCKASGADTDTILLKDVAVQHCTGCDVCYGTGRPCTVHDDMEGITSKMLEADAIVFATPNYFTNVSSLLKALFDRTNPLCKPPLLKGKVAAFICVGAQPMDKWSEFVNQIFINYCNGMHLISAGSVLAKAEDPGEITKQDDTKLTCTNLGNKVIDKIQN